MAVLDQGVTQPEPARRNAPGDAAWRRADEPAAPTHPLGLHRRSLAGAGTGLADDAVAREVDRDLDQAMDHNGHDLDYDMAHDMGHDAAGLVALYESIADLLASRGEWRQAYEHLRHALEVATADQDYPPQVPQQFQLEVARLRREHAEAREQSIRDALTASYNRRYLDQRLLEAVERRGPRAGGLAVALVDLDWFKSVNDTFGHHVGDQVLQQVVVLLQVGLPEGGFCARYGGEEFVLMLPGVADTAAAALVEAARARIEQHPWSTLIPDLHVTVSIGLAHLPTVAGGSVDEPEQLLRAADALLYTAKHSGRNAVAYRVGGEVRLSGVPVGRPR